MGPDLVAEAPRQAHPHLEPAVRASRIEQLREVEIARAPAAPSKGSDPAAGTFVPDAGDPGRKRSVGSEAAANAGRGSARAAARIRFVRPSSPASAPVPAARLVRNAASQSSAGTPSGRALSGREPRGSSSAPGAARRRYSFLSSPRSAPPGASHRPAGIGRRARAPKFRSRDGEEAPPPPSSARRIRQPP